MVRLFQELFTSQAECVARFEGNMFEKALKSCRVLLLFLESYMPIA